MSLLVSLYFLIDSIHENNNRRIYNCKVVETYFLNKGNEVFNEYSADVRVIKFNKVIHVNLTMNDFYNAQRFKKSNDTISYYFSKPDIDRLTSSNYISSFCISAILFFICIALFEIYLFIYVFK